MMTYRNLDEAFAQTIPNEGDDDIVKGLQGLLRSTFMMGAAAALRLIEDGELSLRELREELLERR